LLPECLDDWVGESNPVRAVDVFVEALDLRDLGFDGVDPAATGRPAYHPSPMLKLYIYGYLNRVQSSRRLEREASRNLEVMWLTGRLAPDHKTIADFRKDNGPAIKKVCAQFVELCRKMGLLAKASVAIDGSKFKAVKPPKKKFKAYPIGYFHIDIAELQTAEGKLYLYVAIDRTSKFAFVQLVRKTGRTSASAFLEALIAAVPYKIHTVLTDNGIQFTFPPRYADGPTARYVTHMFDMCCQENGIEHRLTKIKHPWTNGQVERMNRTIKEATVQRYHYDRHDQLEAHLADFINAYNYARRLKTLKGLTPYEYICKSWTSQPERFKLNLLQKMPGLNT
jgi:transposase